MRGFIAQKVTNSFAFKSTIRLEKIIKKYDLIPYDGSVKPYKIYHITLDPPKEISKLNSEIQGISEATITDVKIFGKKDKIVYLLDKKPFHVTVAEGTSAIDCLNQNKEQFEKLIGTKLVFNEPILIELPEKNQTNDAVVFTEDYTIMDSNFDTVTFHDGEQHTIEELKQYNIPVNKLLEEKRLKLFAIDEKQITTFWNLINFTNENHKFQCFKKDGKATAFYDVQSVDELIKLCEKYNLQGLSCLSVNPACKKKTKTDSITAINNLLIDIDVKKDRKKDGVSTPEDKIVAEATARAIIKELEEVINLRVSLFPDSGNGFHIYIPVKIDLKDFFIGKTEEENRELWDSSEIKGKLVALEERLKKFNNDVCEIDCISKDIARRVKIPGTWNIKEGISEENYRMATIIGAYQEIITDIYINGNTEVFSEIEPIKSQNEQLIVELPVNDKIELDQILQKDEIIKDLYQGEWKKHHQKYDPELNKMVDRKKWTRSEAELSLATRLFEEGLSEEKVRNALATAKIGKWPTAPDAYKNRTIERAQRYASIILSDKEKKIIETIEQGNLTLHLLNPSLAWNEIKCYEITDDFVLQPINHPVRGEYEVTNKEGQIETKTFEKMAILLLCQESNGHRRIIYPSGGLFHKTTISIGRNKFKIPSEPFPLKSLPSYDVLQRFLNEETIDGKKVWKDFKEYRQTYLDVGEDKRKYILQTAWDLGTHFHMLFNAYPYNNFFGFRGSGKNRAHEISNELCFHSFMVANIRSISSVFRSIDAMGSTWFKNEAETLIGKNKDVNLLELSLEGYKQGSQIPLTSDTGKDKNRPPVLFDVYSPKSFASDKNIYGAFGTRMIKYLMEKTSKKQGNLELDKKLAHQIRDTSYLLRLQDGIKIKELIGNTSIEDILKGHNLKLVSREREIFYPLLIIIKEYATKKEFLDAIVFIKDYQDEQRQENIDSPEAVILRATYVLALDERNLGGIDAYDKNKGVWIGIYEIRLKIIYEDPEAWRLRIVKSDKGDSVIEEKEIIKSSETARFFTPKKIGAVLSKMGFKEKKRSNNGYKRKINIERLKDKATTLNIAVEDEK